MSDEIRTLSDTDSLEKITSLIHSAYAPHAAMGLRYWGTHQTVEDTRKRFASGTGLVMTEDGRYVGTLVVRPPQPESPVEIYRNPLVWSLSQFCVSPDRSGMGYGRMLHGRAVEIAIGQGARTMALDTAAPARALISMYEAWGYRIVGVCDWRPHTNYESVVMSVSLAASMSGG